MLLDEALRAIELGSSGRVWLDLSGWDVSGCSLHFLSKLRKRSSLEGCEGMTQTGRTLAREVVVAEIKVKIKF